MDIVEIGHSFPAETRSGLTGFAGTCSWQGTGDAFRLYRTVVDKDNLK